MIDKLLTIIVPTYNMEDYLQKCLSSLIIDDENLMNELEVIVVNDGSTDRSSEMAHGFETQYPQTFCVIDKENGHYGSCINAAMKVATGKYVKILDADDWFDTEAFLLFMRMLEETDVDAVISSAESVSLARRHLGVFGLTSKNYKYKDEGQKRVHLEYIIDRKELHPLMHSLTYKRSIFKKFNYKQLEGVFYSDTQWRIVPMAFVDTIEFFPYVLYMYLKDRPGQSVDPDVHRENFGHELKMIQQLFQEYRNCICEESGRRYIYSCIEEHLSSLYHRGINEEAFVDDDIRRLDDMVKVLDSVLWTKMKTWRIRIYAYRHYVTLGFWRKWGGRWYFLVEGFVKFFWDPYKKLKKIILK